MLASNKRRRSSEEWRAVFARQASSGISVQAFCARESINTSSFYRWRGLSVDTQIPGECGVTGAEVVRVQSPPRTHAEFVDLGQLHSQRASVAGEGSVQHRHAPHPCGLELRLDLGDGVLLTLVRG